MNGFGLALGDSIIGLQAMHAAQTLGHLPRPVLVRRTDCRPMVRALYPLAADFADLADLPDGLSATPPPPLPADLRAAFGRVIDMRDFAFDDDFRAVSMVDFFLRRLGLHPHDVPAPLRRNTWLAPRVRVRRVAGLPQTYLLFCPRASMPQRDMPTALQERLLRALIDMQPLPIVTQGAVPSGFAKRVVAAPDCGTIEELCCLERAQSRRLHHTSPGMAGAGLSALLGNADAGARIATGVGIPPVGGGSARGGGWLARRCSDAGS